MKNEEYINVTLSDKNVDNYIIRRSIFEAIERNMDKFSGRLLDVGCGKMPYREYIVKNGKITEYVGLDLENALIYDDNIRPDIVWDGKTMPISEESFDVVIGTEILEHCFEPMQTLSEIYKVLKPGGIFFFTTPFIWPLHEVPHDEFRFTPYSLERLLRNAHFKNIEIKPGGGWHASLAQILGLWVKRAPLKRWRRLILLKIIRYIVTILLKMDKKLDLSVGEQQLFTNFYGTAKK